MIHFRASSTPPHCTDATEDTYLPHRCQQGSKSLEQLPRGSSVQPSPRSTASVVVHCCWLCAGQQGPGSRKQRGLCQTAPGKEGLQPTPPATVWAWHRPALSKSHRAPIAPTFTKHHCLQGLGHTTSNPSSDRHNPSESHTDPVNSGIWLHCKRKERLLRGRKQEAK